LICSSLRKNSSVLEWGCGGSTSFFSRYVANWVCVEHVPKWGKTVQQQLNNQTNRSRVTVNVVEPNNPNFDNSYPAILFNDGTYQEFRDYIEFPKSLKTRFDVIIDDGRARVPVALSVLRNNLLKKNGVLIIHDWERQHYKVLLDQGYDEVASDEESWRHLAILKPTNH